MLLAGGNITVARQTPPYALQEFPMPGSLDAGWLMEQPSRLLDARSQVVGS